MEIKQSGARYLVEIARHKHQRTNCSCNQGSFDSCRRNATILSGSGLPTRRVSSNRYCLRWHLVITPTLPRERVSLIRIESINRLRSLDVSQDARYRAVLEDVLDECAESEQFVRIVDKFNLTNHYVDLLTLRNRSQNHNWQSTLFVYSSTRGNPNCWAQPFRTMTRVVERTLTAMATAGDPRGNALLLALLSDADRPLAVRRLAVKALGASTSGSERLLDMAQRHDYPSELQEALAATLNSARVGAGAGRCSHDFSSAADKR